MHQVISKKLKETVEIARSHKVSKLYLFGSASRDDFNENSDIDFLVEFNPEYFDGYSENLVDLKDSLENLYIRKVDILSYKSIKNPCLLKSIDSTKQVIYD